MLSYRQYKVLKQIDKYQREKATDKNNYRHQIKFLSDDFFDNAKYKRYTIETILSELKSDEYIKDTADEKITPIHAVAITNKGYDALDFYRIQMLFSILSFIGGIITGIVVEHFFEIINLIKTLFY